MCSIESQDLWRVRRVVLGSHGEAMSLLTGEAGMTRLAVIETLRQTRRLGRFFLFPAWGTVVPTIADIAKRAGVSISTVSYVLSGKRPISGATRERVNAAIEELGFRPNQAGRALASKRSNTVAMLYPSHAQVLSEMPLEFMVSAAGEAARRGYSLLLSTSPVEDEEMLRLIHQGFVDGLILMEIKLDDPRVPLLREHNYAFSMIGHCRENDGISYVDVDFDQMVEVAVDHLAELGHRQVALISRGGALHE